MPAIALPQSFVRGLALRRMALFVAILLSGGNQIFPRVPLAVVLIMLCIAIQGIRFLTRREFIFCLIVLIATFAVAALGTAELVSAAMIVRFTNFILGLMMLSVYVGAGAKAFVDDIFPLLKFMCFQAIATLLLGTLVPTMFIPVYVNEVAYRTVLLILNYHVTIEGASFFVRPDGFFYEPGVFQLYLNMFVYLAGFVRKDMKALALGVVAVLSTQSTTGVLIVGGLVGLFFLRRMKAAPSSMNILQLMAAPIVMAVLLLLISANIEDKFRGVNKGSSWAREYDLMTGLAVARQYPFTGIGFDYDRYYEEAYFLGYKESSLDDYAIVNRGNSNGIVTLLYSLGFPLGVVYLFGLFRQRFFRGIELPLILFISLLTEALFFSPFVLTFVFSGLIRPQRNA